MKTILLVPLLLGTTLALGACANNADTNADTASATPATDAAAAAPAATPATTDATASTTADAAPGAADPMAGMSAQEHAAMDAATNAHGDDHPAADAAKGAAGMSTSTQAGWYTAGTFRACGSAQAMKVDNTAEIDAQIKKGGMNAGDPVYVQIEGMPMGQSYMLTRVLQVGSKTPVRNCPMTGTTTQTGG